jgi:class 3 adenylate cyclase
MIAAALGLWSGRKRPDPVRSANAAIGAWWVGLIALTLPTLALDETPLGAVLAPLWLALVPWTVTRSTRPKSLPLGGETLMARVARILARLQVRRVGKPGVLDLRGVTLGALGAVVSLSLTLGPGTILAPLQHQVFEGLLRFRNEPVISQRGWIPLTADARQSALWRRRIVIAEMDPATRRQARTTGSETRELVRVAERLRAWRPLRIVVPLPQLDALWPVAAGSSIDAPPVSETSVQRNQQDLPLLEKALRQNSAALLAMPRFSQPAPKASAEQPPPGSLNSFRVLRPETRARSARLLQAAHESAEMGVDWFGTHRLPALHLGAANGQRQDPEQPFPLLPAAVRLLLAAQGPDSITFGPRPGDVWMDGRRVPVVATGLTPIDYGGPEPLQAFPHVSYRSILNGEDVYETEPTGHAGMGAQSGRWRPAKEYFAGKIVLLTPLDQERVETPVGALTSTEVLAHATVTLASGQLIRPLPTWLFVLGVFALAMLTGHVCAGATPLTVGWRGGLAVLLPLVLAPVGAVFRWWIDPVAPLVAVAAGLALVSQITYSHEQSEAQRQRALLERVAAPQVVDELLARSGQLALGGERREVCILFADVRGFTQFAEGHTADEVITVINRYTTAITEVLLACGGILDHYTGDGLVARFELLHAPKDDLRRAVGAALAMRDAAEAVAARQERAGAEPLRMGFGVHCGEAVVGLVGSPAQFNYTAMGHTVVVAARLQGLAGGGELLISDEVFQQAGDGFACEACEPVWAKGLSEPIRAYRVLGPRQPIKASE